MNQEERPETTEPRTASAGSSGYESEAAREVERQLERAKHSAREAARQVPEKAGDLASRGKEKAVQAVERQVEKGTRAASGRLGTIAEALHAAGERLDDDDESRVGDLAHRAAGQVERIADYLEHKDLRGLRRDLERTARRHPAVFLGGLVVGGVMVGRFLRSSGSNGSAEAGRAGDSGRRRTALARQRDLTGTAPASAPGARTPAGRGATETLPGVASGNPAGLGSPATAGTGPAGTSATRTGGGPGSTATPGTGGRP